HAQPFRSAKEKNNRNEEKVNANHAKAAASGSIRRVAPPGNFASLPDFNPLRCTCYHSCQNLNHALDSGVRSAGPLVALYVSSGPTHPCALWLARRFKNKAALVCECRSSDSNPGGGCLFQVAIAGAFMIGLGFKPFHAAALNLIANTAPVAWGAIGTPIHTLAAVTALPESDLNAMIGRILPVTAVIVPFWLVRTMVGWRET